MRRSLQLRAWIEWGVCLGIVLLPLQTRYIFSAFLNGGYWEYGAQSIYVIDIVWWLVIGLFFIWLWRQSRPAGSIQSALRRWWQDPAGRMYLAVIGLVGIAGLSILWSFNRHLGVYAWFRLAQAAAIMAVIVVGPVRLSRVMMSVAASASLQSFIGTWQFFTQYVPANRWLGLAVHNSVLGGSIVLQTATERWLRAYGLFPHPNMLGGWLMIGLFFSIWLGVQARQVWAQRIWLVMSLTIVPGLFFSFSRSAWVGVLVGFGLLGWWLMRYAPVDRRRLGKIFLGFSFGCMVVLSLVYRHLFWTRLIPVQPLEVHSIDLRLTFTQQAWQIIRQTFPWGAGVGNYTLATHQIVNASWPAWYYQPVHNIFLLACAELGVVGFVFLIWLCGQLVFRGIRRRAVGEQYIWAVAVTGLLLVGLVDHYTWTIASGMVMWWLVVGGAIRAARS